MVQLICHSRKIVGGHDLCDIVLVHAFKRLVGEEARDSVLPVERLFKRLYRHIHRKRSLAGIYTADSEGIYLGGILFFKAYTVTRFQPEFVGMIGGYAHLSFGKLALVYVSAAGDIAVNAYDLAVLDIGDGFKLGHEELLAVFGDYDIIVLVLVGGEHGLIIRRYKLARALYEAVYRRGQTETEYHHDHHERKPHEHDEIIADAPQEYPGAEPVKEFPFRQADGFFPL